MATVANPPANLRDRLRYGYTEVNAQKLAAGSKPPPILLKLARMREDPRKA